MASVFPRLQGETYPVKKRPVFNTIVQTASSGLEVRVAEYSYPLWEWDIPYSWLSQEAAIEDFQTLTGFILNQYGKFFYFLYNDVNDNSTAGVAASIGIGTGTQTQFQIGRTLGGFFEPLFDINNSPYAPIIHVNGVLQVLGTNYTINSTGLITFLTGAPSSGWSITADFNYYWRVRFDEDNPEFSNFVNNWWEAQKITLRQVRAN